MIDIWGVVLKRSLLALHIVGLLLCSVASAKDRISVERLSILGKKESLPSQPGSAHLINSEDLKDFEIGDIHRVLRSVPGVNIQEEDGFGLRPNIGLRGAHPHRSKKITLMEDGVLIAPAPYSAPAAYYFPQLDKMDSIEVFKGVPSTRYGPNSVGGAINMLTKHNEPGLLLDVDAGSFDFRKYHGALGIQTYGDISIDVSRIETTGFKTLANKDNTGFVRHNFTFRWDKYFSAKDQSLTFKFNWSNEDSNETYTGVSRSDFEDDPYMRYTATELDELQWNHRQLLLRHSIEWFEDFRMKTLVYHHEYDRSWNKLNGFYNNGTDSVVPLSEIFRNPQLASNNYFYRIVKGEADSSGLMNNRGTLELGDNQRRFFSQGVQFSFDYQLTGFSWDHQFTLDYRFHQDGINRFHESSYYDMTGGTLQANNSLDKHTTLINEGRADAHTTAFKYETTWDDLSIQAITRLEEIKYKQTDLSSNEVIESGDQMLAPGLGLYYQALESLGLLAGVNKGFTPVGPGQNDDINPEEAINYELGARYTGWFAAELIGFMSDYRNILGTCTQSSGCGIETLDVRYNGGHAIIQGAEFLVRKEFNSGKWSFPVKATATWTDATFANAFTSDNNEWGLGNVEVGDPIPYIPEWQGNLLIGASYSGFSTSFNFNYLGSMPDQAVALNRETIDGRTVVDWNFSWRLNRQWLFKLRVDNIFDEAYAVSMRPFGFRGGRPRTVILGAEVAAF